MYVRMARFEGGSLHDVMAETELIRENVEAAKRGESSTYMPEDLARVTSRIEMMVNRENASVAVLVYCETIQQAAEADRILAGMSPRNSGWGRRVSADVYEVTVDEAVGAKRAA
jgi:hypothetical protein